MRRSSGAAPALAALVILALAAACEPEDLTVPTAEQVEGYYSYEGELTAEMSGNVAELTVVQSSRDLRRGGRLWAMVGPYVILFSEPTRQLFTDFGGLGGVRVVTRSPGGAEAARALLARSALNELTWRRALNIAGLARREGTDRPSRLEALVRWGEDHTEFEYNDRFVPPR